jgi:hypothetical protein
MEKMVSLLLARTSRNIFKESKKSKYSLTLGSLYVFYKDLKQSRDLKMSYFQKTEVFKNEDLLNFINTNMSVPCSRNMACRKRQCYLYHDTPGGHSPGDFCNKKNCNGCNLIHWPMLIGTVDTE